MKKTTSMNLLASWHAPAVAALLLAGTLACAPGEREQTTADSAGAAAAPAATPATPAATPSESSGAVAPGDSARRTGADTGARPARQAAATTTPTPRQTAAAAARPAATTSGAAAGASASAAAPRPARSTAAASPSTPVSSSPSASPSGTPASSPAGTTSGASSGASTSASAGAGTAASSGTPATPATPAAAGGGRDSLLVSQAEYNGWKTYHVYCYRCHGVEAMGSDIAPNLRQSLKTSMNHEAFVQTVLHGRLEKGMPAWKDMISNEKVEELYAYLKARSDGRLAPGRPHTAPKS